VLVLGESRGHRPVGDIADIPGNGRSSRGEGAGAAQRLLRGVIIGSFGFASFFVVIASVVERIDLWAAYLLATCAALAVNGFTLITLMREGEPRSKRAAVAG